MPRRYTHEYYLKNKEKIAERVSARALAHPEKVRQEKRAWRSMIGYGKDSIEILKNAIVYLEYPPMQQLKDKKEKK